MSEVKDGFTAGPVRLITGYECLYTFPCYVCNGTGSLTAREDPARRFECIRCHGRGGLYLCPPLSEDARKAIAAPRTADVVLAATKVIEAWDKNAIEDSSDATVVELQRCIHGLRIALGLVEGVR